MKRFGFGDRADDSLYQEALDTLDVLYEDGVPYFNVHTVDLVNENLLSVMEHVEGIVKDNGEPLLSEEMFRGAVWVMTVWKQFHDEMCLRAEAKNIPDTPESLIEE